MSCFRGNYSKEERVQGRKIFMEILQDMFKIEPNSGVSQRLGRLIPCWCSHCHAASGPYLDKTPLFHWIFLLLNSIYSQMIFTLSWTTHPKINFWTLSYLLKLSQRVSFSFLVCYGIFWLKVEIPQLNVYKFWSRLDILDPCCCIKKASQNKAVCKKLWKKEEEKKVGK